MLALRSFPILGVGCPGVPGMERAGADRAAASAPSPCRVLSVLQAGRRPFRRLRGMCLPRLPLHLLCPDHHRAPVSTLPPSPSSGSRAQRGGHGGEQRRESGPNKLGRKRSTQTCSCGIEKSGVRCLCEGEAACSLQSAHCPPSSHPVGAHTGGSTESPKVFTRPVSA